MNMPTGMNFGALSGTEEIKETKEVTPEKGTTGSSVKDILEAKAPERLSDKVPVKELSIKYDDDELVEDVVEEEPEDIPTTEVDNKFYQVAQSLVENEVIDLDELEEEDYSFDDWSVENFSKFIQKNLEVQKRKIIETEERVAQETYDHVIGQMSDITRRGYELESKNQLDIEEVKDFYRQLVYEADIKSLDPNDTVDAELILKEYYRSKGKGIDYINDTISNLKDIVKEATKVKPELDKKLESIAEAKIEEQNTILALDLEAKKHTKARLEKIFENGDLDGITLTKEIKSFLSKVLVDDEVPMKIRGKEVNLSGAEYLIRFHKFNSEQGDLKHLAKMILYLQSPLLFEQNVIKKVETRETNRKIKEHKESAVTKANIPALTKPKPIAREPKGMVFRN